MTILLDNTILSNFSTIQQPTLVKSAFVEEVSTTEQVFHEMQAGVIAGKIPSCDWEWLARVSLTPTEQEHFQRLTTYLGKGEASCLAVALQRGYRFATDDKDARRWASQLGIPHTGTMGILAMLVKNEHITLNEGNRLLHQMVTAGYHSPLARLDEIL
jgi:predicted nucleic acid-binding protein